MLSLGLVLRILAESDLLEFMGGGSVDASTLFISKSSSSVKKGCTRASTNSVGLSKTRMHCTRNFFLKVVFWRVDTEVVLYLGWPLCILTMKY